MPKQISLRRRNWDLNFLSRIAFYSYFRLSTKIKCVIFANFIFIEHCLLKNYMLFLRSLRIMDYIILMFKNGVSALYHIRYIAPRNHISREKLSDKFSIQAINMKETRLKNLRSFKSFHHKMWEMVNSCTSLLVKLFDTCSLFSWAIMLGLVLRLKESQSLPPYS